MQLQMAGGGRNRLRPFICSGTRIHTNYQDVMEILLGLYRIDLLPTQIGHSFVKILR